MCIHNAKIEQLNKTAFNFLQSALPTLDKIIYFDTDVVVIGNIAKIWNIFNDMRGDEMVAIPRDDQPEFPYEKVMGNENAILFRCASNQNYIFKFLKHQT